MGTALNSCTAANDAAADLQLVNDLSQRSSKLECKDVTSPLESNMKTCVQPSCLSNYSKVRSSLLNFTRNYHDVTLARMVLQRCLQPCYRREANHVRFDCCRAACAATRRKGSNVKSCSVTSSHSTECKRVLAQVTMLQICLRSFSI